MTRINTQADDWTALPTLDRLEKLAPGQPEANLRAFDARLAAAARALRADARWGAALAAGGSDAAALAMPLSARGVEVWYYKVTLRCGEIPLLMVTGTISRYCCVSPLPATDTPMGCVLGSIKVPSLSWWPCHTLFSWVVK